MNISCYAKEVDYHLKQKGFYDNGTRIDKQLFGVISEILEAFKAFNENNH
jgi:hypothetical protein